jgi:hypothetical protein
MHDQRSAALASPAIMLISAAIFGYFAWSVLPTGPNGQVVPLFALLDWTLTVSAIAFAASGLVAFARPRLGNLLFGVVGLIGAGLFVVIAVMDLANASLAVAVHPVLLLVFAAWNGYGSWSGLQALRAMGRAAPGRDNAPPA